MDITTTPAMQPAHARLGQRSVPSCALTTDRSLALTCSTAASAPVGTHRGRSWALAAHTEGLSFGMFSVRPTTLSTDDFGYAGAIDGKGDRMGSPAWSPPV